MTIPDTPKDQPGQAASQLFPCPMERWADYAKRGGLLDENGVATDRMKAQAAFYAFSAAWNESHHAVRAALAAPAVVAPVALFHQMVAGYFAEVQAERAIEKILGLELDTLGGIGFDYYDNSFEIYAPEDCEDIEPTPDQVAAIRALGCDRFWINFKDATERYCGGNRRPGHHNRWRQWDDGDRTERRRVLSIASPASPASPSTSQVAAPMAEGAALSDSKYGVGLIKFCDPTTALRYLAKRLREAGISDAVAGDYAESIYFLLARRDDLAPLAALAHQEPAPPVDEITRLSSMMGQAGEPFWTDADLAKFANRRGATSPVERQPLPEFRILEIARDNGDESDTGFCFNKGEWMSVLTFARDLEAAHDIPAASTQEGL